MKNSDLTIEQVFEDVGWIAKWEARGEVKGVARGKESKALEIAQKMINSGFSLETVTEITELDPEITRALHEAANGN